MPEGLRRLKDSIRNSIGSNLQKGSLRLFKEYELRKGIWEKTRDNHYYIYRIAGILLQHGVRNADGFHQLGGFLPDGREIQVSVPNPKEVKFPDEMIHDKKYDGNVVIDFVPNQQNQKGLVIIHRLKGNAILFHTYGKGRGQQTFIENSKFNDRSADTVLSTLSMYGNILNLTERALLTIVAQKKTPF